MQQISKVTSVLGFAMLGLVSSAAADSSDPIKIAVNEWTGQHVSAHISGSVLQAAGYTVEYVTAGAVPQFAAIAQGNLHLQPETWGNNVGDIYPNSVANGDIVVLGVFAQRLAQKLNSAGALKNADSKRIGNSWEMSI